MGRSADDDRAALYPLSWSGVMRRRDLLAAGLTGPTVSRRCRPDGPWRRLLPGIVLLAPTAPTAQQVVLAALLYAGGGSVLTGVEALSRLGLNDLPDIHDVHVLVPHGRRRQSRGRLVIERTTRLPEPILTDGGVPVAPVARAVLDAARRLSGADDACQLIASAVQRRLCSVTDLEKELCAGSQRGSALPRRELLTIADGVRSVAEKRARRLVRRSGLPPMMWNPTILDSTGRFLACPDGWFDDVALAWEIDSMAHHLMPAAYASTLDRRAHMVAAGIIVAETRPTRLERYPRQSIADLVASYQQAALRPRPDVRAIPATKS